MTNEQIKYMVDRFLGWRLPNNFNPDGGISFKKTGNTGTPHQYDHRPTGTNLLDATQVEAMVRYMIEGMADLDRLRAGAGWHSMDSAPKDGTHILVINRHNPSLPATVVHWHEEGTKQHRSDGSIVTGHWYLSVNRHEATAAYLWWGVPTHWRELPAPPEGT